MGDIRPIIIYNGIDEDPRDMSWCNASNQKHGLVGKDIIDYRIIKKHGFFYGYKNHNLKSPRNDKERKFPFENL